MTCQIKARLRHYITRRHHDLEALLEAYPSAIHAGSTVLARLWELRALHQAFFPTEALPLPPGVAERPSLVPPIETTFTEVK